MSESKHKSLSRLLRPQTIAVIGGTEAARVIEQCQKVGFKGELWAVHPSKTEVNGVSCFRSVAELPGIPDAVFVGVNRLLTAPIVEELARIGAGGAVCYASGFAEADAEVGDGALLQTHLLTAAGDMPILGPNCYGFINILDGALLWPDQHGLAKCEKGVAIIAQSSNITISLTMQQRGLPIAYALTVGNQAQIGLSDIAKAVLLDPRVTALGLHIEGFDDVVDLAELAALAREMKKPIVALKMGKSDAAQQATLSHTASLAGDHQVSAALLQRLGIAHVDSIPELLESLKLLHVYGALETNWISSMSCSGGEASLIADLAESRNVDFIALTLEQRNSLREVLGGLVKLSNPLDYHTFVWNNFSKMADTFEVVLSGKCALNILILDFPRADVCSPADWRITLDAVIEAKKRTGAPLAVAATMAENMPEAIAQELISLGIVPFSGLDETLAAIEAAHMIGVAWQHSSFKIIGNHPDASQPFALTEAQGKKVLERLQIRIPAGCLVSTEEQALNVAQDIGYPVVLKAQGVAHKTEAGAVAININSADALKIAIRKMRIGDGNYLVEQMITERNLEMIIGIHRDPVVGLVLTLGAGGVLVELLSEFKQLILPLERDEIRRTLQSMAVYRLLKGFRGQSAYDVESLIETVKRVADYAVKHSAQLEEFEINPLLVLESGKGVVAVDALINTRRS
ncbi:acetate--CoA ligase family protein [Pseudomonas sp. CC120222-01a]|uniref:acetate--CoA ligase family protein n=1 Tax=Pseudomonas sp. CC120222-01a TaxID=1378075 RepID=UPI000D8D2C62|nr:acetate--CoA ligase family protein [Pseudomonas sp. CC120222-01a]PVZ42545.1 acyl-CoA synthetase (NDP forming) [Pseudomonas sp. CC120222-01a]